MFRRFGVFVVSMGVCGLSLHCVASLATGACEEACHGANCFENTPGQYRAIDDGNGGSLSCKRDWHDGANGFRADGDPNIPFQWQGMSTGGGGCSPTFGITSATGCADPDQTSGTINCVSSCIQYNEY